MESIIDILKDNKIISISKDKNGIFTIEEECDNYYRVNLTKNQMISLSKEIQLLAES